MSTTATPDYATVIRDAAQKPTLQAAGAAITAALLGPVAAAAFAAIGVIGINGRTRRLDTAEATRLAHVVAAPIQAAILAKATPDQLKFISDNIPAKLATFMVQSDWWNEREGFNIEDARTFSTVSLPQAGPNPADRVYATLSYMFFWIGKNTPADRLDWFQDYCSQIFASVFGQEMAAAYYAFPASVVPGSQPQGSPTSATLGGAGQMQWLVGLALAGAALYAFMKGR